jgi:hypothetical protein
MQDEEVGDVIGIPNVGEDGGSVRELRDLIRQGRGGERAVWRVHLAGRRTVVTFIDGRLFYLCIARLLIFAAGIRRVFGLIRCLGFVRHERILCSSQLSSKHGAVSPGERLEPKVLKSRRTE